MKYIVLGAMTLFYSCSMEAQSSTQAALDRIVEKQINNKTVFGATVCLQQGDRQYVSAAGNLSAQQPYFIASTTKLYTTALVMQLRAQGRLNIDDPIAKYLPAEVMHGLHTYKGYDYSSAITIRQLLSQTTGLPDYFLGESPEGGSFYERLTHEKDAHWTFEEAIAAAKKMRPEFAPGTKGKALYSDTNYQLLGKIIEVVTGKSWAANCQENIFTPLHLIHTWVYSDTSDIRPAALFYQKQALHIPMAMTSFQSDGGLVATAEESMVFLRAFFNGELFPKAYLEEMYVWNKVMFPLQYGVGLMRFKVPRLFSPFKAFPELLGHSGLSGAFAYYCPEKDLWITGTVNQIDQPSISYKLMVKLVSAFD